MKRHPDDAAIADATFRVGELIQRVTRGRLRFALVCWTDNGDQTQVEALHCTGNTTIAQARLAYAEALERMDKGEALDLTSKGPPS